MTETTSAVDTAANARTVETFLYALQDDYFDMWDITKATLRGVVATVFPSLRPTL
jgi:limonene-1,2-epoxide hydrolase